MSKEKEPYGAIANPPLDSDSAEAGITFAASSPEDARQQADDFIDEVTGDTTPGEIDVQAVVNENTGEETRFD